MSSPATCFGRIISGSFWLLLILALSAQTGCRSLSSTSAAAPTLLPSTAPEFSPGIQGTSEPPTTLLKGSSASAAPIGSFPDVSEERVQAFRPIVPPGLESPAYSIPTDHIVDNIIKASPIIEHRSTTISPTSPASPSSELTITPIPASPPRFSESQIGELNSRIANLEKSLADKEEQLRLAKRPQPLPVVPNDLAEQTPTAHKVETQTNPNSTSKPIKSLPVLNIPGILVSSDPQQEKIRMVIPDSLLFQQGSWQLNPDAEKAFRKIVGEIKAAYPNASLDIEGHTDNIERDPSNKTQQFDIASHKSMLVMQYFVKTLLWNPAKIKSSSYGSSRPAADNETPEGRDRNNRIEIVISP